MVNESAQNLGRLAKGVPKTQTPEHKAKLRKALSLVREKRWPVEFWTSYFNCKRLNPEQHRVVSIAAYGPRFGAKPEVTLDALAPDKSALAEYREGRITWDEYSDAYIDKLESFGHKRVVQMIREQREVAERKGKSLVLACHCGPGKACHREILAAYHGGRTKEI